MRKRAQLLPYFRGKLQGYLATKLLIYKEKAVAVAAAAKEGHFVTKLPSRRGCVFKTEHHFWRGLKTKIAQRVYAYKVNDRLTAGIPDVWFSGDARDMWAELKYEKRLPPTIDPRKYLSALQQNWLRARHRQGRRVAAVIGSPAGHVVFPGVAWETPVSRDDFVAQALTTQELADHFVEQLNG